MSTATILDKLERLERAATPGPFQTGGATPHHSDTLVLWDAVFDAQGSIIAYVVNEPTTHLFAHARNALLALLRVARATVAHRAALDDRIAARAVDAADVERERAAHRAVQEARGELDAALAALAALEATP